MLGGAFQTSENGRRYLVLDEVLTDRLPGTSGRGEAGLAVGMAEEVKGKAGGEERKRDGRARENENKKGIMILTERERLCTCNSSVDGGWAHGTLFAFFGRSSADICIPKCIRDLFTCLYWYHFPLFAV
jgi:hypothetical protein